MHPEPLENLPPGRSSRWLRQLSGHLGPLLALLIVVLLFSIADMHKEDYARYSLQEIFQDGGVGFNSVRNFRVVLVQTATVAVAALGMTLVIIAGGIDLSAGTAIALCATVLAWFLKEDYPPAVALIACVLTGGLCGLVNGKLVSLLRIVPFIVTLGTMTVYLGIAKKIADETTVRPPLERVPDWLKALLSVQDQNLWLGLPLGVWLVLALALLLSAVLRYTVFGRHVFALGSSEATARLCGIHVPLLKISVYTIAGLFIGLAGMYQFARLSVGNPTSGTGLELRVIAAVVIGGGSLSGGQGSVLGTLTGAAIMAVITSGCSALGYRNATQDIIIGVIIIAAVSLDQLRQRRFSP